MASPIELAELPALVGRVFGAVGMTDPVFYLAVGLILALELAFPASASQPLLGRAFFVDASWMFVRLAGNVILIAPFIGLMVRFYEAHLAFLTVPGVTDLPSGVRLVSGILIADLVAWFHHFVRHKIAWSFHAIHHSQPELNLFTDDRNHVVDLLVSAAVRVFPMMMFSVETPQIVGWALFGTWFTRLYHANIRSNFGILRHVLVTPQSHRIHHSMDPQHHEKNFGLVFSFWDRLFGTQYEGWDEYPATGVPDPDLPLETRSRLWALPIVLLRQQIHPFVAAGRSLRRMLGARSPRVAG